MSVCNGCKDQRKIQVGPKGSFYMAFRLSKLPCVKSRTADGQCGRVKKVGAA
ncbi:hypothetical protein UFOVP1309_63 [uncultured Caudovirales phage]|uniref:Uncharacterized protein n=1 Tax=uncultured Caudovirales phage TaxID=2100421 RepID=A0A6J5RQE8_9CAUD|nr:hypothetical protein UFOVP1309_63 [uncultured Caudovirales phage]